MDEDCYAAYLQNDFSDANQISAAAAVCSLLFSKPHEKLPSSELSTPSFATFQPELDLLADFTRQIQKLQLEASNKPLPTKDTKSDAPKHDSERSQQLASLHCRRAQSILACVDYDALTLLSASFFSDDSMGSTGSDEPEEHESDEHDIHEESDQGPVVNAVEKALEDAFAAIALAPASADAYCIAAQCARSLGRTSNAVEYITLALQFAPERLDILKLSNQLSVDAKDFPLESLAPPLLSSPQLLSVFDVPNQEQQQQDQQEEEAEDLDDDAEDQEILRQSLEAGLQTLTAIVSSSWLEKLEQMMHQNVHHQCAARDEVHDLEKAFTNTTSFLLKLLGNRLTTSALGMDHTGVQEMLAIAAVSSSPTISRPAGGFRLLVENRSLRKWIGQTLAPAVRRFLSTLGRKLDLDSLLGQEGSTGNRQQVVAVTLLRDTLLVLTRVLLTITNWRRCTSMPHVILYAELCFDLSKELGAGLDASFSGLSRFEMFCNDAYARSLLILTPEHNDALQLHQESLQVAMTTKDAEYEVRCHHHVGQAFMRMDELELAQSEFREMLQLSQTLGDSQMECLAQYELGECCVQSGNLPQAQRHFKLAQTLCHQTANAHNTWRQQSVQQAIAFYTAMKPARRGAIRVVPSKTRHRRGSLFRPALASAQQQHVPSDEDSCSHDNDDAPKLRRPAIWIGPPKLNVEPDHDGKRSLLKTLLGEQTEPIIDSQRTIGDNGATNQPLTLAHLASADTQTATAKLFAATIFVPAALLKKPETPKRTPKPRRNGVWRDSVFAIPPSYSELKSLTSSSLQSPVAAGGSVATSFASTHGSS